MASSPRQSSLPLRPQNPLPLRVATSTSRRTAMLSTSSLFSPPASSELDRYKKLFAAAEDEIIRLRAAAGSAEGAWGKERDRAGIREQVDRGRKQDRRKNHGSWVWIKAASLPPRSDSHRSVDRQHPLKIPSDIFPIIARQALNNPETLQELCLTSFEVRQGASPMLYRTMLLRRPEQLAAFFLPPPSPRFRALRRSLTLDRVRTLHFHAPCVHEEHSYPFADLPLLTDLYIHTVYPHRTWEGIALSASIFLSGLSPSRLFLRDDRIEEWPEEDAEPGSCKQLLPIPTQWLFPFIQVWWELRQLIVFDSYFHLDPPDTEPGEHEDEHEGEHEEEDADGGEEEIVGGDENPPAITFFDPPFHPDLQFVQDLGWSSPATYEPGVDQLWTRMQAATGFSQRPDYRPGSFVVLYDKDEDDPQCLIDGLHEGELHRVAIEQREDWYDEREITDPTDPWIE